MMKGASLIVILETLLLPSCFTHLKKQVEVTASHRCQNCLEMATTDTGFDNIVGKCLKLSPQ